MVGGGASRFSLLRVGAASGELVGCVLCIRNNDTEVNKMTILSLDRVWGRDR